VDNVKGFPVYGALPVAQRMIDALATGQLDIAVGWGPTVGYYARRATVPIDLSLAPDETSAPESFSIAIAVRDDESELRDDSMPRSTASGHGSTPSWRSTAFPCCR
jgi:ABC-type amino acid transport substrate-binding protein